jgi:hypothetical protein
VGGHPKPGEREVAAELLGLARAQGILRAGMVVLAEKGLGQMNVKLDPRVRHWRSFF